MEHYEYEKIIHEYENQFNVDLGEKTRKLLVKYHQQLESAHDDRIIPFNVLCREIVIKEMCNKLRPGMELYDRVYTIAAQN